MAGGIGLSLAGQRGIDDGARHLDLEFREPGDSAGAQRGALERIGPVEALGHGAQAVDDDIEIGGLARWSSGPAGRGC